MLPLVFLLFTAFSFAETGGVDNIFSFGVGLRALGMGGAFIAMDNDPTLAYWNPGAMAFNQYKEISLFGTRTIADTYYFAGFYTNPTTNLGTLGIGAIGIYTNGIESYDENASPITGADTNYIHYQILLSYGYNFRFGLGLGATAKIEQMKITDYRGTGASFDVGAYYNPPKLPWLSLGLVVQDVYGTGIKLDEEFEKNTRIYKAGLATNFLITEKKKTRLSFALDSRFYTDNYNPVPGGFLYDFSFGTELAFSETLMIRAGYKSFSPQYINFPVGISVGLGVRLFRKSRKEDRERGGFGIDYAVTFEDSEWQGPAELLMRIGLSYRFGKSIKEQIQVEKDKIQEAIKKATDDLKDQHKAEITDLKVQHEVDIADINKKHEENTEDLKTQYDEEKQRIDEEYAVKVAALESEGQEKEEEINLLKAEKEEEINLLKEEHGAKVADLNTRHDRVLSGLSLDHENRIREETLKSEGYSRGLEFFSDGHYQEALDEFEAVEELDDNYIEVQDYIELSIAGMKDISSYSQEIQDIYRNGIALFVDKKYAEAIEEWEKILKDNPNNTLARKYKKIAESRLKKLKDLGIEE
ncbi:hypothetical protein ES705_19684 [subsurface metagenome]